MPNNEAPTEIWRVPSAGGAAERWSAPAGRGAQPLPPAAAASSTRATSRAAPSTCGGVRSTAGRDRRLTLGAGDYLAPRLSRDGRRLVCEARTSIGSLRVVDLARELGRVSAAP